MCALLRTGIFFLPHDYRQIFVAPKQIVSSHAKEKRKEKKSLRFEAKRIFETSLTMKTIRIPQGRKKNKKLFRIVFEDYFLKKSGNNVNVFSLGILLFARLIESSIIAYSRFCRVLGPRLLCLVKIINMEKISVEPLRCFTRFSCFS